MSDRYGLFIAIGNAFLAGANAVCSVVNAASDRPTLAWVNVAVMLLCGGTSMFTVCELRKSLESMG